MRNKGTVSKVVHPVTGVERWSEYPVSSAQARKEHVAKYWPMTPCPVHGGEPVHYTRTETPGCCAVENALRAYGEAQMEGEPVSAADAHARGLDYFWVPQEGAQCGHPGKRTLTNQCYFCKTSKSPRQEAVDSGSDWYMPEPNDPCARGHVALRRVANGICSQCAAEDRERKKAENVPFHRKNPDMIITRETATALGLKVYRTGEPCRQGHRGFRYISTGNCLECMGR